MASIERRKNKEGKTSYRVKVRLKGYPAQSASFERRSDAKNWAQLTESAIKEGRHFKTTEAKRHTLAEVVDRYIQDVLPTKPKSEKAQKRQLLWWREAIGSYLLADVTPSLVAEQRDKLLRGITPKGTQRSPSTVNRYLAAMSHAFTVAMKEWGWVEDTPFRKITKPKESRGRVRFLSDDERKRLLVSCREHNNPFLYAIVVVALSTGARQGEILNLRWKDIDMKRGMITLYETKNNEIRAIPLRGHAFEVVQDLNKVRRIDTDLVFPSNRNPSKPISIQMIWERAMRRAEIEDFRFHDLRHSAASYLAMSGASLAEIAAVLGHKTLQMVKRYAHLSEQHTSSIVEKMNSKIFG